MNKRSFIFQMLQDNMMADYVCGAREALREFLWLHPEAAENTEEILVHDAHSPMELPGEYLRDGLLVPVGSIEFCETLLRRWYGIEHLRPINIPSRLLADQFTGRKVAYISSHADWENIVLGKAGLDPQHLFVKRADRAKAGPAFFFPDEQSKAPSFEPGRLYLVSECVDIASEWRAFVWKKQILDIRCYPGNPWAFPNRKTVEQMVATYTINTPMAYTLDVAVLPSGRTVIMEVHNFIACGLYGFADPRIPLMLAAGVNHEFQVTAERRKSIW